VLDGVTSLIGDPEFFELIVSGSDCRDGAGWRDSCQALAAAYGGIVWVSGMASDRGSAEMCCNVDCGAATVPVEATASAAVASPIKGGEAAAGSGEATAGVGVEAVRAGWLLVGKRCTSCKGVAYQAALD
jgi:hypothetical protein